jgi:hypothetical protein
MDRVPSFCPSPMRTREAVGPDPRSRLGDVSGGSGKSGSTPIDDDAAAARSAAGRGRPGRSTLRRTKGAMDRRAADRRPPAPREEAIRRRERSSREVSGARPTTRRRAVDAMPRVERLDESSHATSIVTSPQVALPEDASQDRADRPRGAARFQRPWLRVVASRSTCPRRARLPGLERRLNRAPRRGPIEGSSEIRKGRRPEGPERAPPMEPPKCAPHAPRDAEKDRARAGWRAR